MCRIGLTLVVFCWLGSLAQAQSRGFDYEKWFGSGVGIPPFNQLKPSPPPGLPNSPYLGVSASCSDTCPHCWGSVEYLYWRISNQPNDNIFVTTGDRVADGADVGSLGASTTQVLFAGDLNYGNFSGVRATVGGWVDWDGALSFEASAFLLERRSAGFGVSSDALGSPGIYLPFLSAGGVENHLLVADPAALGGSLVQGSVFINTSSQTWGADATGLVSLGRTVNYSLDAIGGFAYRNLEESLDVRIAQVFQPFSVDSITTSTFDSFQTRNQFFGGHVGGRFKYRYGAVSVDLTAKVLLGTMHQTINVTGVSTFAGTGTFAGAAPPSSAFGFFTQPSNIGRATSNAFTAIPEISAKVGLHVTPHIKLFAGYDAAYWSNVVRPGRQVDRSITTNGNDIIAADLQTNPASGIRPTRPSFEASSLWLQGVNLGVEFRY